MADFKGPVSIFSNIHKIVKSDLESTGLFRMISKDAYIENPSIDTIPTFQSWRQLNSTILLVGKIEKVDSYYRICFKIWDVFSQKEIANQEYKKVLPGNLRKVSHAIADEVYQKLTGEKPYFNTKISYVSLKKNKDQSESRNIAMMDQDGFNHRYLTNDKDIVITPRFSPNAQSLLYLSYKNGLDPHVYTLNTKTKVSRLLGDFSGMSYSPRYIDGLNVLLAVSKKGVSNIYRLNMKNMEKKQMTSCSSICTSPSVSPDKKQIVFNSDMGGSRQIYVMNTDGKDMERISFNEGQYSSPLWSPRGDLIAFTKMLPGKGFFIGVMRPDGSRERLITRGWLVDSVSWAPNGRVLMFEKEKGPGKGKYIYTIDITGHNEKRLKTPGQASDPSWSRNFE
jgi:TolB protein